MSLVVDTQVDTRPQVAPTDVSDIFHLVCCRDDDGNVALCGEDVSDEPWEDDGAVCVMCEFAGRRDYCPLYGRCVDCD